MPCLSTARMTALPLSNARHGIVRWAPVRSIWIGGMTFCTLLLAPLYVTPGAVLLWLGTSAVTLCLGHSIGLHRLLIHRSLDAPRWFERLLAYLARWSVWPGHSVWCGCTTHGIGRNGRRNAMICMHIGHRCCATPGGKCIVDSISRTRLASNLSHACVTMACCVFSNAHGWRNSSHGHCCFCGQVGYRG